MRRKDEQIKEICEGIRADERIPFAFDHFTESEAAPPPFIIYRRVAAANFSADGIVYSKGQAVDLELYAETPEKMAELMELVEARLDAAGIFYNRTADTAYITSEDFYETLYEI